MSRYKLEPYKGRRSRHQCPQCGRKRCFTRYVDENGDYLDDYVGRCDHESSCGYHYTPRQYFQEHPTFRSCSSNIVFICKPKMKLEQKINVIDMAYVHRSVRKDVDSDFVTYLRHFISNELILKLIDDYHLGVTHSGDVIFFEIDKDGLCRTGKIMKYNPETGHRVKDEAMPFRINWVHSELKKSGELPSSWNVTQCLFGEHLLRKYPDKIVALVEAEKTAVICAAFMPEYIWLATGGKSQLNDRVKVLAGREVIAFPDLDAMDEWSKRAANYPEIGIKISHLLLERTNPSERDSGRDLADWIIEWATNITNKNQL